MTPLPRYYEPLRLPIKPRRSYGFPRLVDAWLIRQESLERVSQVPDDSVGIRCPLSPRRARPLHLSVASRSMAGFTPSGRLATLKMFNEAESGSRFRITADAFAFRGSDRRITPTAARSATGRTNNYPGQYLATDQNRQASPDAPEGNKGNKERPAGFSTFVTFVAFCKKGLLCLSGLGLGSVGAIRSRAPRGMESCRVACKKTADIFYRMVTEANRENANHSYRAFLCYLCCLLLNPCLVLGFLTRGEPATRSVRTGVMAGSPDRRKTENHFFYRRQRR